MTLLVQANTSDPDGELRLGDRLWMVLWDLDLGGISERVLALVEMVRAGRRMGITSESADRASWCMRH